MTQLVRKEIVNGPSEMRLMMSLFRQAEGANLTYFSVKPESAADQSPTILPVEIDTLTRRKADKGACDEWYFEGKVLDQGTFWRMVAAHVKGELNTSKRTGWMDCEDHWIRLGE